MVNGIGVYQSDEAELFHQLHDTELRKADDQGKHVAENGDQGKKMVPALARQKTRLLFIAVAVFIVIGAAIGGGVGRASSHRKSVVFRGRPGQRSHS
jgi:hypothetical protein